MIKIFIGVCLCKIPFFTKYKYYLLSTWNDKEKRSKVDKFLYPGLFSAWIRLEYLKEANPYEREKLKSIAMGGVSGRNWAERHNKIPLDFNVKIGNLDFHKACPLFEQVENICKDANMHTVVVQIGSCSGRETAYFAKKFPEITFIGTDIYEEIVSYSRQFHNFSNLSFQLCSADNTIENILRKWEGKNIIIFSHGSLQYVQPEFLIIFFKSLTSYHGLKIILLEPAKESAGNPDGIRKSIWKGNFSYTHDYKYYAETAGLETKRCEIIKPYLPYRDFPMHNETVHYFYSGVVKRESRFH